MMSIFTDFYLKKHNFQKARYPLEVLFENGFDEAFHVHADIKNDVIVRWAVVDNVTQDLQDDGDTTIDFEEPFVLK